MLMSIAGWLSHGHRDTMSGPGQGYLEDGGRVFVRKKYGDKAGPIIEAFHNAHPGHRPDRLCK